MLTAPFQMCSNELGFLSTVRDGQMFDGGRAD